MTLNLPVHAHASCGRVRQGETDIDKIFIHATPSEDSWRRCTCCPGDASQQVQARKGERNQRAQEKESATSALGRIYTILISSYFESNKSEPE